MPGQALALQGFPGIVHIKRGVIHSAAGIANDAICGFVSILCSFELFEAEFDDDLFFRGQLYPLDEAN